MENTPEFEITQEDIFDYSGDDEQLARSLNRSIKESKDWFDKDPRYKLSDARKNNDKLWLGHHGDANDLYDYELINGKPYVDNRIFVSTEAVVSYVTAQVANPEAYGSGNTETSQQLAEDVSSYCKSFFRDNQLMLKAKISVRHLLNQRVGWFKWLFDPTIGENGEIVVLPVDPSKIIVDHKATIFDNPRFIAEEMEDTVSEIIKKFPDAKEKIKNAMGWSKMSSKREEESLKYYEVHFTDYEKGEEAVLWLFKQTVFGKMRDPNWNYDNDKNNFLKKPQKPYINLNWINTGKTMIDDTTLTEQAETLQYTINARGRQINDNANRTNPTKVFSGEAMDANNASQLTGAPDEAIILRGKATVRDGFAFVQSPQLPQAVYADKQDQRNELDNVFKTPNVFRGQQQQGDQTLGELQMVRAGAQGGLDDLIRAIDDFMDRNVKFMVQMMKVHYTEDHYIDVEGDDGEFDYVAMSSKSIETGLKIRVTAESTVQLDKIQMTNVAVASAKMGMIDPLSYWEVMGGGALPTPRKIVERLMTFKTDPAAYLGGIKKDEFSREAFADLQIMLAGKEPKERNDYGLEYMNYLRKFVLSGEFREVKEKIKNIILERIESANELMKQQLQLEETQQDPPQPPALPGMQALASQGAAPGGQPPMPPNPNAAMSAAMSASGGASASDPNAVV